MESPPPVAFVPVPITPPESVIELARWRGQIDEKLLNIKEAGAEAKQALEGLGERIMQSIRDVDLCGKAEHTNLNTRISTVELALVYLKTKIAVFAGIAGVVGGALASTLFNALVHRLFE